MKNLAILLAACAALGTGRAVASPATGLIFDDENAIAATYTSPTNPQVALGVGATIQVANDTPITNFALETFQLADGSQKFVVYDETTASFVYKSAAESFAADTFDNQGNANFTFKTSPTFSLTLLGGHTYDLGGIANVDDYYAYNLGPTVTQNGITSGRENVLLDNYSDPAIAPNPNQTDHVHGTAEFALQIMNGSGTTAVPEPASLTVLVGALFATLGFAAMSRQRG